ncbi:MAG TPA: exosome complex protein Rrp4 [Candidatus Norongarragalinales archaeon]|jgi:exosome complex component RRP4|nr:exosome complex protein Rrp4 [Candidatus Norongarragalinales archaeon]
MDKEIVSPGTLVSDKPVKLEGTYVENGRTYAAVVSLKQEDRFVPLKGIYTPQYGDVIVGVISEERFSGYTVDLNSPFDGNISAKEIREEFTTGDVVSGKIVAVNEMKEAVLLEARKLSGGMVMDVEPVKVPRIIGRNGSMLQMLQQYTQSQITVGKNGRVFIKGGKTQIASDAIHKIAAESHTSGLTERVKEWLETQTS